MDLGLRGKTAIVTGGSKGIGRGIAILLAAEGAEVVVVARGREALDDVVAEIGRAGGAAFGVAADTSHADSAETVVREAMARFSKVDILVNNAGGQRRRAPFAELTDQDFLEAYADNVLSTVRMVRAVIPGMRERGWGRIINVVSEAAVQPDRVSQHYNAAKAAQLNLSKSLSRALTRDGILVNAVSPGLISTPGNEADFERGARQQGRTVEEVKADFFRKYKPGLVIPRAGEAFEVAAVVALLASELCSYVTGSNFRVDGGSVVGIY